MNKDHQINDWKPETTSLFKALIKAGFKLVRGNNGGDEDFTFNGDLKKFIDEATAADECHLRVFDPALNRERWLYLVFGNSPGELVSDYSVPRDEKDADNLSPVIEAQGRKWETRKQPMTTYGETYPELFKTKTTLPA